MKACPAVCIVIVNSFGEGKCKQTVWSGGVRCFLLTDYRRTDIIKAVMYMTPTDTAGKEPFPLPALQEKRCALGNAGGHLFRQDDALTMQRRYTREAVFHTGYPDGAAHYADRGETANAWRQAN